MKRLFLIFAVAPLFVCFLFSCRQEEVPAEATDTNWTVEVPVVIEDMTGTKQTVDRNSGACRWEDGDAVAVYISSGGYRNAGVVGGAVRLDLRGSESREKWAVYPAASSTSEYDTPRVKYPTAYNYDRKNASTYCPAPMVANNTKRVLSFYHVGGVLALHLRYVPKNTNKLTLTFVFTDTKYVTGVFDVASAGTASSSTSIYRSDGKNEIVYSNITIESQESEVYLNVPLPAQDYSTLTSITVKPEGGDSTSPITVYPEGLGYISRGQMVNSVAVDFVSVKHNSGYTGKIAGYYVSPGVLKWDTDAKEYTLTDGSDPLELLRCYNNDAAKDVLLHRFVSSSSTYTTTLKYRLDGRNDTDAINGIQIQHRELCFDGVFWRIPTTGPNGNSGEVYDIMNSNISGQLNGTPTRKFIVVVDLATAKNVNGYDYSASGMYYASSQKMYLSSSGGSYAAGIVLIPDNAEVFLPSYKINNYTSFNVDNFGYGRVIPYYVLKILLDGGCVFLLKPPGYYNSYSAAWYWTASAAYDSWYQNTKPYYWDGNACTNNSSFSYLPVKLIR